jgi:LysM repeat protein
MKKQVIFSLLVTVILSLGLSACQLRASTPPAATATAGESFPFPVTTQQPDVLKESMTQTAAVTTPVAGAKGGTPVPTVKAKPVNTAKPKASSGGSGGGSSNAIPTLTRPKTYTLQAGEFPFCIARRFDVPASTLLSLNGLTTASQVHSGTVLQIPSSGHWNIGSRVLRAHPVTYTVRGGDTINTIACQFGDVSPEGIIAANSLKSPYSLTSGQSLQIP